MDSQNCDFTYGVTDVKVEEDCEQFEYVEQKNILSMHSFLESQEGSTVISLFREFLEYIGLKLTISAYEAEVESFYQYSGRTELAHNLKLDPDREGPLIVQVLSDSIVCRTELAASEAASVCSSTDEVVGQPTSDCEDIVINTEDLDENNKDLDFVKVITVDSNTPTSSWRLLPTISRTNTRSLKRTKRGDNPGQSDNGRQQDNGNNTIIQNQILLSPCVNEVGNDNTLTRKPHSYLLRDKLQEKPKVNREAALSRKKKLDLQRREKKRERDREYQRNRYKKLKELRNESTRVIENGRSIQNETDDAELLTERDKHDVVIPATVTTDIVINKTVSLADIKQLKRFKDRERQRKRRMNMTEEEISKRRGRDRKYSAEKRKSEKAKVISEKEKRRLKKLNRERVRKCREKKKILQAEKVLEINSLYSI